MHVIANHLQLILVNFVKILRCERDIFTFRVRLFNVGPTIKSSCSLHKVVNYYNELFHQVSVSFIKILRCEREVFNPEVQFWYAVHMYI